ncbi:MAG TPA: MBL fold metallo-hydrolase [Candidatus Hodarchaeales archaeon]|nr:MBL fold metallo-hydrolase [Candidatus Hodarchaeales archaeon]
MNDNQTRISIQYRTLGSGNAFSEGGRLPSSHWLTLRTKAAEENYIVLDCGPGSITSFKKYNLPFNKAKIMISHLHGDHFAGIPFLLLDLAYFCPRKPEDPPLTIYGPVGANLRIRQLCEVLYPKQADFLMSLCTVGELAPNIAFDLDGVQIQTFPANHAEGALIYRISVEDSMGLKKSLVYTGDNELSLEQLAFMREADALLTECTAISSTGGNHTSWHLLKGYLTSLKQVGVKRLILVHLGEDVINMDSKELRNWITISNDGMEFNF